ncbi:translation initiation factor IF-2 [Candidatus Synechococcus calcipolaris G9]|uniref:Translation initiation factor IF-2 n=1 Tax=Candidatus Synechococcus calcipolaris G9 TaxID=1497997 RepID=A0ABT6ETQ4_9SYNE|nr:translation initiation factor IF-2 [Candidatus Synechococcus calcipolaris]MDG2989326.1 translation initiation factor IF-2 [Candidatus Synechococcus calcipolaris G9]
MGFVDLAIADLAADYAVPVEQVCQLCDRLGISYRSPQTRLALEDAKAIILILVESSPSRTQDHDPVNTRPQS